MDAVPPVRANNALGEWLHARLKAKHGFATEQSLLSRMRRVDARLQNTRLHSRQLRAEVLRWDKAIAFAAPGGRIYIRNALVRELKADDALAFVLAYEIAHHDLGRALVYKKRLEALLPL